MSDAIKILLTITLTIILFSSCQLIGIDNSANISYWPSDADYRLDRINVKSKSRLMSVSVQADDPVQILERISALYENYDVEWAEPDWIIRIQNDPRMDEQWYLSNINAFDAWKITRGAGTKVGVIDTGINNRHPDLQGQIVLEHDFIDNDNRAQDGHGHGTHVAGIIAAESNDIGVSGVCPDCKLYVCKALDDRGYGSVYYVTRCINWLSDSNVDIINMSLGTPTDARIIREAIEDAQPLIIAAAGNQDSTKKQYPAGYDEVVAVAATNRQNHKADFSNFGDWISLAAPGEGILSTYGNGYGRLSGTSMAAPMVSGVAGLVNSRFKDIRPRLEGTARDIGDPRLGAGLIDAFEAVTGEPVGSPIPQPSPTPRPSPTSTISPTRTPNSDREGRAENLINDYRKLNGKSRLLTDFRLTEAARGHSQDMQQNNYCGHYGSDGSSPYDRMREAGFPLASGGEIVACGYSSVDKAIQAWQNSSGHRRIMLRDSWTHFACGIIERQYTCVFARTSGAQPTPIPEPTSTAEPIETPYLRYCLECYDAPGLDECSQIQCDS